MGVKRIFVGAAALGAAGLLYANLETRWFEVKRVTVPILPPGQPDIRVLQLADLHYLPSQDAKTRWLESLGELKPDLVVDTGDNVSSRASIPALLDVLGRAGLLEVPGVFVGGSNDYYAPIMKNPARYLTHHQIPVDLPPLPWRELFGGFEAAGWVNLNNRRGQVTLPSGQTLDFVGTDDAHHENDEFPAPSPTRHSAATPIGWGAQNLKGALASSSSEILRSASLRSLPQDDVVNDADSVVARIGVTHAPYLRVLQQFKDDGVALVIAGHTHGGQLRIPGFGAIVTNCDLDRHRAEGLHGWPGGRPDAQASLPVGVAAVGSRPTSLNGRDSIWLYVSAGAGTSPYTPFRFDCRPSATLLTLTAAP